MPEEMFLSFQRAEKQMLRNRTIHAVPKHSRPAGTTARREPVSGSEDEVRRVEFALAYLEQDDAFGATINPDILSLVSSMASMSSILVGVDDVPLRYMRSLELPFSLVKEWVDLVEV